MSLSRKDTEDLRPKIDNIVLKFLGFNEPALVTAAVNCLDKGYDKHKTIVQLGDILDDTQAIKFADKLFNIYDEFKSANKEKAKKRKMPVEENGSEGRGVGGGGEGGKKVKKFEESALDVPEAPPPVAQPLSADKIREMMLSAQKMIEQRKAELSFMVPTPTASAEPTPSDSGVKSSSGLQATQQLTQAMDKARKANELQARIQAKLANVGLASTSASPAPTGPTPLILDSEGRTIDISTGQTIQLRHHMPTLKANIRAKKRQEFKAVQERPPEEISESKFFDGRLSFRGAVRNRRSFKFHEKGKFEQLAQRLRTKAQLDRLQNEIAQAAKKTGIASVAKLATIQPKKVIVDDDIPEVEWWDAVILKRENYSSEEAGEGLREEDFEGITHLVEHPVQMKPPSESDKAVEIAVILTSKERKKLRRQTRQEAQKEIQEKIRLGLMPPPEPKLHMANLMRVLGTEAVQDPTKVEAHVRAQMAKRQKDHEEANAARKLTKEQRRDKKMKKMKEDTSLGVHVSVYRVRDLSNPAKKFKIEKNCQQLFMTGIVVIHKDCSVIVVEGGPKQQRKFRKLVLSRIKWSEDNKSHHKGGDDDEEEKEHKENKCDLVWEGTVKTRAFGDIKFKLCPTESFAREQFKRCGVEQYWDLAYSSSVLEQTASDDVV